MRSSWATVTARRSASPDSFDLVRCDIADVGHGG